MYINPTAFKREESTERKNAIRILNLEHTIERQNEIISHYGTQVRYYKEREQAQLSDKGKIKFSEKVFLIESKIAEAERKKHRSQLELETITTARG